MVRLVAMSIAVGAVLACNALSGVGDLEVAAGGGALPDAGTQDDASPPLETCATGVCVPTAGGWAPVARMRDSTDPCPPAFATPHDVLAAPAPGGCTCKCSPVGGANPCDLTVSFTTGFGPTCSSLVRELTFSPDGQCTTLDVGPTGTYVQANPRSAGGAVACNPEGTSSLPAPTAARYCAGAQASGEGCGAGESCVPRLDGSASNCVAHDGDVPCPASMSRRDVFGVDPTDTRACPCACEVDRTCKNGSLTLYRNGSCLGNSPGKVDLGTCGPSTSFDRTMSGRYVPSSGCQVKTPPGVIGSVTFAQTTTVCCP